MSGYANISAVPDQNILYNAASGHTLLANQNALLEQQTSQANLDAFDQEQIARAASSLRSIQDPAARAAAYPQVLGMLSPRVRARAPATLPDDATLEMYSRLGTPSKDLYAQGIDRQAKGAIAPGDGGTTATGGTGGGGGGTGGDGLTGDKAHDLPLIAQRESGGNPTVLNYVARQDPTAYGRGATASGKYQIVNSTWREGMQLAGLDPAQYATARDAPEQVQDKVASAIYDKYGAKPWQKGPQDWVKDEQGRYQMATVRPPAGAPGGAPSATAPGGATATGVVTGNLARPGDVPPPPWGAPGAYGGGGFGAVVARPPVVGTSPIPAGRPTGPPVVTDQPAGSNVVAGPPGVATVGAPQPPGPAVAGNVDAINAGIVRAGGQPAADPYATPARFAGTAPAPPVEAAPQPGWGTGIGSGYGPQNTLAPASVPAAPARPAVPAPVATATQPPAADTLPPLPAPTPPAPTNRNGLTPAQQQDINNRRTLPNVSADELQKRVDAYVGVNAAAAEKYQQDQIAYVREARERQTAAGAAQHQTLEEQRQAAADAALAEQRRIENARAAETQRLAQEQATKLQQSKSDEADAERVLMAIGPKVRAGTDLTPAEADQYDIARRRYARGPLQQVPDGKGGTITAFVGQEVPDRFPPLPGQKEYAGLKPIPGTEKQPDFAPANAVTAMLDIGEGNRKIVRALDSLNAYPGGVGAIKGSLPNIMQNWTDPEGVKLRSDIGDVQSHVFHTLSGAAVTASEAPRLKSFSPNATDTADALKTKLQRMLDVNRETLLDHYRAFGPDAGGRKMPGVEEEILSTIPQTALDHLKENPSLAKDFDKQFGRGSSKLVLQNG